MKIAIVCGHYIPALGYLEVHLSRAFAKSGHSTFVITSNCIPHYVKSLTTTFGEDPDGVNVIRLKPYFSIGQIVKARGINLELNRINPDLVLVIGLGKVFPKPVFKLDFKVLSLLGDNAFSYSNLNWKSKFLFNFLKKDTYEIAIKKSHKLIAYTPESFDAAAKLLSSESAEILRSQSHFISLGFWPEEFYFNKNLQKAKRSELGFRESDIILITATRVVTEKNLEAGIELMEKLPKNFKWLIVGLGKDVYSGKFKTDLESRISGRYISLPYASRAEINAFYNAADIAFYTVPAISIFEAAGTGLPLLIPKVESLTMFANHNENCQYRHVHEVGKAQIDKLRLENEQRQELSITMQNLFSWPAIAKQILDFQRRESKISQSG